MSEQTALFESSIPSLPLVARGKVRDIYACGESHLLIVTTDRLSAYDVVLPDAVPGKGAVLTAMSNYWFDMMRDLVPNHLAGEIPGGIPGDADDAAALRDRTIYVRRLEPLPIEAVVRGYLIGSGWRDYADNGSVCGIDLPRGLELADKLPGILFTPATKAAVGDHDINIGFAEMCDLIGPELAERVRDLSIAIYERAANHALQRGIIIADTKFEFGLDQDGQLYVIDEMLTPDSSRFWPEDQYEPGSSPPSFDKQFLRDYLDTLDWDKTAPGPSLPADILRQTADKYREALSILTA
ncbi:MAG: phosphoribosylaminoimidazolesuccinocarboxamide synthase [Gammaproteobacteria bacterium]|nr:phosphoribosylaminoimidazolesuccinocarboxamide synthase [Gammaproteobacteria bacterium]